MRASHVVTLGFSVGIGVVGAWFVGCGTDTSGTCTDTNTCAAIDSEGGPDSALPDVVVPDGTTESGGGDSTAPDSAVESGGPDAGDSGTGDGGDGAIPCDTTLTPSANACVITDAEGVFVSPMGTDGGAGTKVSPLKSVQAAIAKATGSDAGTPKRVYACAGTYAESLSIAAGQDGVQVFGGLDCTTWKYVGADAGSAGISAVAPTKTGYALQVTGLTTGVHFEDFSFTAQPGVAAGESSIGVFVNGSSGVVLRRCGVTAGAGQAGQDAAPVAAFTMGAPSGQAGTADAGGPATSNPSCSTSVGGAGGDPGSTGNDGNEGMPAGDATGGSAVAQDCALGSTGHAGTNGDGGAQGDGATVVASFGGTGWTPSSGTVGGDGAVGEGGGGGASVDTSGGGGAGGPGGCGGSGGAPGTGGGSSISVLLFQSKIDLEQCVLVAGTGGQGGTGASGQQAQARGARGNAAGLACLGGNGGFGGSGGGGGGGAGGVSAGVVWSGTAPVLDGTNAPAAASLPNITTGTPGAAGKGGAGGAAASGGPTMGNGGQNGTDGLVGTAMAVIAF